MTKQDEVSDTILKILENNPDKWISSNKIKEVTGFLKQSINWSLRNFEEKGIVKRERRNENECGVAMNFVKYIGEKDEDK